MGASLPFQAYVLGKNSALETEKPARFLGSSRYQASLGVEAAAQSGDSELNYEMQGNEGRHLCEASRPENVAVVVDAAGSRGSLLPRR